MLLTFLPVAVRGGRRHAFLTTSGNSIGVLAWGCFAAAGIAAIVAASAAVFDTVKLAGASGTRRSRCSSPGPGRRSSTAGGGGGSSG